MQQYVQAQIPKLRSGSLAEKAEALKGIGEPRGPGSAAWASGLLAKGGCVETAGKQGLCSNLQYRDHQHVSWQVAESR